MASITLEARTKLIALYVGMFKAAPGSANLSSMVQDWEAGKTMQEIAAGLDNADFRAEYPAFLTAEEFADKVIANLLGNDVAQGQKDWTKGWIVGKVNAGISDTDILVTAVNALRTTTNTKYATAQTAINNKVEVAEYYTVTKSQSSSDLATLQGVIANVTSDAASVTTAKTTVDTTVAAALAKTFTLTTGVDTGSAFTGGDGDDSFVAVDNPGATVGTFNAGDSLTGGAGTDKLTIAVSGAATPAIISTSGIERLEIVNNSSDASETYNASLMAGLDTLKVTGGTSDTIVSNSQAILNVEAVTTNKNITTTSATPTVGTADSMSVTLNNAATTASITITSDGVETVNLALTGAASGSTVVGSEKTVTIASNTLEKVIVTGDQAANLVADLTGTDNAGEVAVFDASAATGNITAALTAGGSTEMSVKGGSGDDKFDVGALDSDYTIDGGDGTDTLVATAGTYVSGTKLGANVSGFERISAKAAGSVDLNNIANSTFVATIGAGTYSKAGSSIADSYLNAAGSLTLTRLTDGAADTLNLHLTDVTADTTYASVSLANEETLSIAAGGAATGITHTISSLTATDLKTLTVTGSNALVITAMTGETNLATVDASGHTGKAFTIEAGDSTQAMTVTGSAGSPTTNGAKVNDITTGSGADKITTGDQADSITSGVGNDSIVSGGGNDTINAGNGNDTIDAGDGNDSISAGSGDDSIVGGAGNDSIDAGSGVDTIVAGDGNDVIKAALSDNTSIDAGAGSDRVSNTTGTITATTGSSVSGAFISVADSVKPTLTGVETLYVKVDADAGTSAANQVNLDLTNASSLTTLHMGTDDTGSDAFMKVTNFAGSSITVYGGANFSSAAEADNIVIDGVSQSALTFNLQAFEQAAAGTLDFTGIQGLTIASDSTSQLTGSADQDNALGIVTANSVTSVSLTSNGSAATNAAALTVASLSASNATSLTLTSGKFDDYEISGAIATSGNALETFTLTVGTDSQMTLAGALNFGTSTLTKVDLTVDDGGFLSNSNANTTIATGEYVDINASKVSDFNVTVDPGATASLDLTGIENTDFDATIDTAGTLVLRNAAGLASTASNFNISGRGTLTIDDGDLTTTAANIIVISGSSVVWNSSGLTNDSTGLGLTATGGNDTITMGVGADSVDGGAGNDTINLGEGADTIQGGAGNDVITLTETTSAADNVILNKTAVAGSVSDWDKITGFTDGTDNIVTLDSSFALANGTTDGTVVLATGATLDAAHAANNNFSVATISTNVATHTFATFMAGTSTIAELEGAIGTALGAATNANFANTDKFIVAIDDGTHTGIVFVESAADGDAIGVAELSLLGILQSHADATTLVAGDFLFA